MTITATKSKKTKVTKDTYDFAEEASKAMELAGQNRAMLEGVLAFEKAVEIAEGRQIVARITTWENWTHPVCGACGAACSGGLVCGMKNERFDDLTLQGLTCLDCYRRKGDRVVVESLKNSIDKMIENSTDDVEGAEYWQAVKIVFKRNSVRVEVPKDFNGLMGALADSFAVTK